MSIRWQIKLSIENLYILLEKKNDGWISQGKKVVSMKNNGWIFSSIIKKLPGGGGTIMPCVLTNGALGYFPVKSAYDEGGYEARTSPFKAGVTEKIVEGAKELLRELDK